MENFKEEIMQAVQRAENQTAKELTQHQLTTGIVTKLNTYQITPTAKLVLLYLTTCYNPKHADVFPKQKTIADKLGISERSVTRAIQELCKEGLVLVECKYSNRYKFTSKIVCSDKMAVDSGQNDIQQDDNLSLPYIEPTIQHDKRTTDNSGENVYKGDDLILYEYAKKKAKYNVDALIKKIKENGGDKKIIKDYKAKENAKKRALRSVEETQSLIRMYENMKKDCVTAAECGCSLKDILNKKRPVV